MTMTSIEKHLKRFEAYKNGVMVPEEEMVFLRDLERDNDMAKAWSEYNDMMLAFSDTEAVSMREKLDKAFLHFQESRIKHINRKILSRAIAATIVLFVMGTLLYFYCSDSLEVQQVAISSEDVNNFEEMNGNSKTALDIEQSKEQNKHDETEICDNEPVASLYDKEEYQISPVYSELLHNIYRSNFFKLTHPADSILVSDADSVLFIWETNISDDLYFDILDRSGQVVYTHHHAITSPWSFKPALSPAIYMFRFATKEEPVWMGVIIRI